MREVLLALNALVAKGVIDTYAIGGAVGASFYVAAFQTEDVDAFVFLRPSISGLIDLSPIYSALVAEGGRLEREYVCFGLWPLQILPDATPLIGEAIREAAATAFEEIQTRVFSPEHLCCIALEAGRAKDYLRVQMFLDQEEVDMGLLREMAERFQLGARLLRAEAMLDDPN